MIVIVDYGMGNLASIQNMIKKISARAVISSNPEEIKQASKLIFPGVGAFDTGMRQLEARRLRSVLNEKVLEQKTPILGICLGMQLLTRKSEEGTLPGLGWIEGDTIRFKINPLQNGLKIPHMGWNTVRPSKRHFLLNGFEEDPKFYFVHSYHLVCDKEEPIIGKTHHGYDFPSVIAKDNIFGVQFHPEKSHKFGMQLFRNFLSQN